ncbi:MAG: hypothetical protein ACMUHY_01695 [Thermoplasmatota archaeon]
MNKEKLMVKIAVLGVISLIVVSFTLYKDAVEPIETDTLPTHFYDPGADPGWIEGHGFNSVPEGSFQWPGIARSDNGNAHIVCQQHQHNAQNEDAIIYTVISSNGSVLRQDTISELSGDRDMEIFSWNPRMAIDRESFVHIIYEKEILWRRTGRSFYESGDYFIVHARFDPDGEKVWERTLLRREKELDDQYRLDWRSPYDLKDVLIDRNDRLHIFLRDGYVGPSNNICYIRVSALDGVIEVPFVKYSHGVNGTILENDLFSCPMILDDGALGGVLKNRSSVNSTQDRISYSFLMIEMDDHGIDIFNASITSIISFSMPNDIDQPHYDLIVDGKGILHFFLYRPDDDNAYDPHGRYVVVQDGSIRKHLISFRYTNFILDGFMVPIGGHFLFVSGENPTYLTSIDHSGDDPNISSYRTRGMKLDYTRYDWHWAHAYDPVNGLDIVTCMIGGEDSVIVHYNIPPEQIILYLGMEPDVVHGMEEI